MNAPLHVKEFTAVADAARMDDLRRRIRQTRWPAGETGGVTVPWLQDMLRAWEELDWSEEIAAINRWPQFVTAIEGQTIHFIHRRIAPDAPTLLLLHGWPGSFLEFEGLLPLLEDFNVVVPSLPGYGYSRPVLPGTSNKRIAELFVKLMDGLGYAQYLPQGGDWGAGVATWMARLDPKDVRGIHLNYIPGSFAPHIATPLTAEEEAFLARRDKWLEDDGAYGHVQRTRPLTLAYGLHDSPAALAAWILEKFREWADPAGAIPTAALLRNLTLYWMTETAYSSMLLYQTFPATPLRFGAGVRVIAPCAVARFPLEAPFPPRSWVERAYNVVRWTDMKAGGHFAALEQPAALAADVRAFAAMVWA
jgi:pimeloyl-ACP methyl ester carboxylesterase